MRGFVGGWAGHVAGQLWGTWQATSCGQRACPGERPRHPLWMARVLRVWREGRGPKAGASQRGGGGHPGLTGDDDALPKGVELRAPRAPKHLHHVQRRQLHPRRLDRVVHLEGGGTRRGGRETGPGHAHVRKGPGKPAAHIREPAEAARQTTGTETSARSLPQRHLGASWAPPRRHLSAAHLRALDDHGVCRQVDAPGQGGGGHKHLQPQGACGAGDAARVIPTAMAAPRRPCVRLLH